MRRIDDGTDPDRPSGPPPGRRAAHERRTRRRHLILGVATGGLSLLAVVAVTLALGTRGADASCPQARLLTDAVPAVAVPAAARAAAGPIPTSTTTGQATHYGAASPGGACSFPAPPADGYTTAVGPTEYAQGAACGTYLEVTGSLGTIVVKVDNLCPECAPGHLDLSDEAFAAIDDLPRGLVPVTYRALTDADPGAPLQIRVKEGSSQWWLGILVDNHPNPLAGVEISAAGQGSWQDLTRTDYNYWLAESGAGTGPFDVRVSEVTGAAYVLSGVTLSPSVVQTPGADPAAAPRTPTTAPTTAAAVTTDTATTSGGPTVTTTSPAPAGLGPATATVAPAPGASAAGTLPTATASSTCSPG